MFKMFVVIILNLLFCHISAIGQTFDTSNSLTARQRILTSNGFNEKDQSFSSFKIKLGNSGKLNNLFQEKDGPVDRNDSAIKSINRPSLQMLKSSGGESAGGGNLLELKIAASIQKMFEGLQKKNPDNLNLETFQFFIENTVIKLSKDKKEFYLQKDKNSQEHELRDAVNFFPQQWLLKLYTPAWEKYYALNMDVEDVLYHEFLLFFFNHDKKYSRSKLAGLGNSRVSILTLVLNKVEVMTPGNLIQVLGQTIDRREKVLFYCSIPSRPEEKPQMDVYYYRGGNALASTNSSSINPFVGCDDFEDIKTKLQLATTSCPVIVDLDRKAVESGHIVLLDVRTTCGSN